MTRQEKRIALLVFALFLPALAALAWGTRLAGSIDRPGALRAFAHGGQDHLALVFRRSVHIVDAEGRPLARQPLHELGLSEEPTDLDITVDPQGRLSAWLFEDTLPRVVRCRIEPAPWRFSGCAQVLGGPLLRGGASSLAVHLAVDAERERAFIAAASGNRVRAFSLRDGRLLADSAPGQLFFPNRLRVAGDQLIVADNDHHRIAWLDIADAVPTFRPRRSLALLAHPQSEGGGSKAADFALRAGAADGAAGLWVLAVAQGQKEGRLLLYGPQFAPAGVADTRAFADPLVIDRLGGDLVASDFNAIGWFRIGADGRWLGEFGQGELQAAALAERAKVASGRRWTVGGAVGMAVAVLAGFALALRARGRAGGAP
jgi:hypothetical protein